jgi:hypothetical protein
MSNKHHLRCILPLLLWFCSPLFSAEIVHQRLWASLHPDAGTLQVEARLILPMGMSGDFLLHSGLNPRSDTPGVRLIESKQIDGPVPLTAYSVTLPAGMREFSLSYGGRIKHQLTRLKESPGRSSERLAGTIASEGIHLDGTTAWYPRFPNRLQTFELRIELPAGWSVVSQGAGPETETDGRRSRSRWQTEHPQDEIYLIAAPFHLYSRKVDDIETQVYLRESDPSLASAYLDATAHYLRLYRNLIGPYPYPKFALVENFWQTGYGMPSFTLLGSRVIRLPFILHTSYPHEILHNWWGNSVYVDYQQGNWSEGLTSYLADHLLAEQQGRGSEYRRSALQRYADFIHRDNDFPLRAFRGRHSTASQAVGYDKSLMLFHMLRRKLGDKRFIEGLRRFYRDHRFRSAGFSELQASFESVADYSLSVFFKQWLERTGAPRLMLEKLRLKKLPNGYRLSGQLRQTQSSPPYTLQVPVLIELDDASHRTEQVNMEDRLQSFSFELPVAVNAVSVDPWFDLFRTLDPAETPPSLGQLFGADQILILLPSSAEQGLLRGYRQLASRWATDYRQAEIRLDREVSQLPTDRPVLLLGWENRFTEEHLDSLADYPIDRFPDEIELWQQPFDIFDHSFALAGHPAGADQTHLWVASQNPESLAGLTRKLPHYSKYSALVFFGDTPDNRLKRQWPVTDSPLRIALTQEKPSPLPVPAPLVGR